MAGSRMRSDTACDIEFIGPCIRVLRSSVFSAPLTLILGTVRPNGRNLLMGTSDDIAKLAAVSVDADFDSVDYHYTDMPDKVN